MSTICRLEMNGIVLVDYSGFYNCFHSWLSSCLLSPHIRIQPNCPQTQIHCHLFLKEYRPPSRPLSSHSTFLYKIVKYNIFDGVQSISTLFLSFRKRLLVLSSLSLPLTLLIYNSMVTKTSIVNSQLLKIESTYLKK